MADDLGFGDLGYTGSDIRTPVIDGLADAGQVLGHYYVMHCCSPTRSALHMGRYNIRYGLQTSVIPNNKRYGLSLEETLMPQFMKQLGYATHATGKWHLGLFEWKYTPTFRGCKYTQLGSTGRSRSRSRTPQPPPLVPVTFLRNVLAVVCRRLLPRLLQRSQDYFTHKDSGFDLHLDIGPNCGPNCSKAMLQLNGTYSSHIYADRAVTVLQEHPSIETVLSRCYRSTHR